MSVDVRPVTRRCVFVLLSLLFVVPAFGQGARMEMPTQKGGKPRMLDRDDPHAREAWFRRGRQGRDGIPAAELLHRAYGKKMQMRAARRAAIAAELSRRGAKMSAASLAALSSLNGPWKALGPAPSTSDPNGIQSYGYTTGRATGIAVDPNDATGNTVYLAAAGGGIWKSTNAACATNTTVNVVNSSFSSANCVTWTNLTDTQASLHHGAIAVQPGASPPVVLAGTGEPDDSGTLLQAADSYFGVGILRSTNAGASWSLISSADAGAHTFKGMGFSSIAFSTLNNQVVVAATAATPAILGIASTFQKGLYFSANAGASWSLAKIMDGSTQTCTGTGAPNGCSVTSVVFNPFANGGNGAFFAVVRFHGIYESTDNGHTFVRLTHQPGPLTTTACPTSVSQNCPIFRGELAVRTGGATNHYEM